MEVVKYVPLNWGIIKHPANWVIVLLMVIIAGFALDQAIRYFQTQGSSNAG